MGNLKLFFAVLATVAICIEGEFQIGLGRADVTGPSVEVPFMGYGNLNQRGHGIHLRQYARAFIVEDASLNRVVFVSADLGMISHAIRREVVRQLQLRYGNLYTLDNVMLAPTHTHGGPGGYHQLVMYDITCLGFIRETFEPIVNGIVRAINNAHNSVFSGRIFYSEIPVNDVGVNRSPVSYLANPEEERKRYSENIDRNLQQIIFVNAQGETVGAFNWLATHAVSMSNENLFISSDNLGYASILLEQEYNPSELIGKGNFIGAFSTSNSGDISPNVLGPRCNATGLECDALTSVCPDDDVCIARGPGSTETENTKIIGTRIYNAASQGLKQTAAQRELTGTVAFIHQFIEMSKQTGTWFNEAIQWNETFRGCASAMGFSFGAGTTDGPGATSLFFQGDLEGNELFAGIRDTLHQPSEDDFECHAPKPILLMTGHMTTPYLWQPQILPTQIITIGDAVILGVPGEITTMAGRRLRSDITFLGEQVGRNLVVLPTGMANTYSSYFTTWEEYQVQRYEAGSTAFGPHSFTILQQQFSKLFTSILTNETISPGPSPPDQTTNQISFLLPVTQDLGNFGSCLVQPKETYQRGEELFVTFVAGNPRNNLTLESSFFFVEELQSNGAWVPVATDANWETRFIWRQTAGLGRSEIDFYWDITQNVKDGVYRVRHNGASRGILTGVRSYQGFTQNFNIVTSTNETSK